MCVWQSLAECSEAEFDLIVLSHVLEHIAEPRPFLGLVRSRLAVGGYLFIEVPNQDYRHKSHLGTHLLSFSPEVLARLVGEAPGLRVLDVQTVGPALNTLIHEGLRHPARARRVKDWARRWIPASVWSLASSLVDRARAAHATLDSLEDELQLSTYGPGREWIRCLAQRCSALMRFTRPACRSRPGAAS